MKEEEAEGADGRSPQGTEPEEKATCRRKDEGNFGWPRSDKAQKRVFFLPPLSLFFGGCPLSEAEDGEGFGGGGGGGGGGADSAPVPGGEGGAGGASCVKCGGRGIFLILSPFCSSAQMYCIMQCLMNLSFARHGFWTSTH